MGDILPEVLEWERRAGDLANSSASLRDAIMAYHRQQVETGGGAPLGFWWPVGTLAERQAGPGLPGDWFDAVPFGMLYTVGSGKALHPACDLNRPGWKDSGAEVYAPALGRVSFAGSVAGWQGWMVIIEHTLDNGNGVWSQLAHLDEHYLVKVGQTVERGELVGHIGEYLPVGPANDHLHFALRKKDIPANDWPGLDRDRMLANYYAPIDFMAAHWARG